MGTAATNTELSDRDALNNLVRGARSPTSSQATVTSSATIVTANSKRKAVTIKCKAGTSTVYIGPPGVSSSDGFEILAGEAFTFTRCTGAIAAVSAGTSTVFVMEEVGEK